MHYSDVLPWLGALGGSAWLCFHSWNPATVHSPAEAAALPRPASPEEVLELNRQAEQLSEWMAQAQQESGGAIPLSEVEAHLPQPIFNNPLVDGHGGIQESCPTDALENPGLDWIYCPEDGSFSAHIPGNQ